MMVYSMEFKNVYFMFFLFQAPFKFIDRVFNGLEIQQYGDGTTSRGELQLQHSYLLLLFSSFFIHLASLSLLLYCIAKQAETQHNDLV